jgi:hypothetical protein
MAFWTDGQDIFLYSPNDPVSPTAPTAGFTAEVAVECHQGRTASSYGDEASRSLYIDYAPPVTTIAWPIYVPLLGPQYDFPPRQASSVRLSVIRVHINVS